MKAQPCIRCGYCCKQAPCPFGVVGYDGWCVYLVGPGPGRYTCGIEERIRATPGSDIAPAFGAGCCSALNSTRRELTRHDAGNRKENDVGKPAHNLMPKSVEMPPMYATDGDENKEALVRWFQPWGSFTWYVFEYDPETRTAFAFVTSCLCPDGELGYVTLDELEPIRGPGGIRIERDLHWTPKTLKEIKAE